MNGRDKRRKRAARVHADPMYRKLAGVNICLNCGASTLVGEGHFFGPSLGDRGFWICADMRAMKQVRRDIVTGVRFLPTLESVSAPTARELSQGVYLDEYLR